VHARRAMMKERVSWMRARSVHTHEGGKRRYASLSTCLLGRVDADGHEAFEEPRPRGVSVAQAIWPRAYLNHRLRIALHSAAHQLAARRR
jgi:hypothetical protein